jgi:uncharacterized cupin superfamily protein
MAPMSSFAVHIPDADLEPERLDPDSILDGTPETTGIVLFESEDGRVTRGLWQCTPGRVTDVEADEMFVVVSGRATIEFEDGASIDVGPGDVCVLEEGARTVWTVHETLRKAYQITSEP